MDRCAARRFCRFALDRPGSEPSRPLLQEIESKNQTLGAVFPARLKGALGIFFFVSRLRAVSCLSNQFLMCLESGCSRIGSKLSSRGTPEAHLCFGCVYTTPMPCPQPALWTSVQLSWLTSTPTHSPRPSTHSVQCFLN